MLLRSTLRLTQNVCGGTQETSIFFFQIALNVHFKQARHIQYWSVCTVVYYNFLYLFPILYVSRSFLDNYKDDSKFNTHVWLRKKKKKAPENGHRRSLLKHNKGHIYNKPTANIILNSEKLKSISSKTRNKTRAPFLPLFNIVLEVLATKMREEDSHCLQITWYNTQKKSNDATRKLKELFSELSKVIGYKINTQKSLGFLYNNTKYQEEKLRKGSHSPLKEKE